MSFTEDKDIVSNKWQIDCPTIEIFDATNGEFIDTLSGEVYQNDSGQLYLKAMKSGSMGWWNKFEQSTPGKLIGGQYKIKAYSYNGDEPWEATSFGFNESFGRIGFIIKSDLQDIHKTEKLPSKDEDKAGPEYVDILMQGVGEFPTLKNNEYTSKEGGTVVRRMTRDESELESKDLKFTFFHDKDNKLLKAYIGQANTAKGHISSDLEKIITHAVQFVTGNRVQIILNERFKDNTDTKTISSAKKIAQQGVKPPLLDIQFSQQCLNMLETYISYMLMQGNKSRFSVAYSVQSVINSGGSNLEAKCLTISVEIENLINNVLAKKVTVEKTFSKNDITKIKQSITAEVNESQKERVSALVDSLNTIRAKDRLYKLISRGIIKQDPVKSWEKLRNKSAHGSLIISTDGLQEYTDHYDKCLTLFYKLIFLEIGYKGTYSDYSAHGYHKKEFEKALKGGKK